MKVDTKLLFIFLNIEERKVWLLGMHLTKEHHCEIIPY